MNFYHLKYFFDSANCGSVAQASKINFVTQSAISQGIRKLEQDLDCELLVHKKNCFVLTDSGRIVYEKCQSIFQSVENLKNETKLVKREMIGSVVFATSHSIALSILPAFLAEIKFKFPLLTPKFRLGKTPIIKRWLEDREIDFAITVDDGKLTAFQKQMIHSGDFLCVAKSKNKSTSKSNYILTEARPETIALTKAYRLKFGKPLPIAMEVDSWEVTKRLASEGLGVGLLPEFVLSAKDKKALTVIREKWMSVLGYQLCVIQNKNTPASRLTGLFIESLAEHFSKSR